MHVLFFWGWLLYCYTSPGEEKLLVFKPPCFCDVLNARASGSDAKEGAILRHCRETSVFFFVIRCIGGFSLVFCLRRMCQKQVNWASPNHIFWMIITVHIILFMIYDEVRRNILVYVLALWCVFVDFVCFVSLRVSVKMPSNSWGANSMESKKLLEDGWFVCC